MTSLTLDFIQSEHTRLGAEHARVGDLIEQLKKQSIATEYVIERAVIPLYAGERFAGPILKEDGTLDYYLIKMAGQGNDLEHAEALAYAVGRGGKVPNRQEGHLLMANLPGEFEKKAYWLEDEYEPNTAFAWCQGFIDGTQYYYHESAALPAVAVRRFIPSVI